jgi:hypothetical protein
MATFETATGKSIQEAFDCFHSENPHVYELFKRYVREIVKTKGRSVKTSSKMIINRIRWEVYLNTTSEDFRINDAFTSRYARKFSEEFPDFAHLFNYRDLRSN